MKDNNPIIVEQVFNLPVSKVWKSITNVVEMRHWFFDNIPDFKPIVGFSTEFNVSTSERDFLHQWKIVDVKNEKLIAYNWSYPDYLGKAKVIFELSEENANTKLTVTSLGMDSFPQDVPEFKRESCIAGWNYFIKQSLKQYLDNK